MSVEIKIKDYEKIVSARIEILDVLKTECQYKCINNDDLDDDFKKVLQEIIQTKNVEEWNEICRGLEPICQEYYNVFHSTENTVAELNDLVKQMESSLNAAQIKRIYIHDNPRDSVVNETKTKIDEMTVNEFKEKLNQKINACSSKLLVKNCEMRKIQIYIDVISKLNREVQTLWDNFMKKNGLKSKNVNIQASNLQSQSQSVKPTSQTLSIPSSTEVRIKNYENVSEWIESLKHLRSLCKTECLADINLHEHETVYQDMQKMVEARPDEEWNAVCRHRPNDKNCEQYHTKFHQTRALILRLIQLCKQINEKYANIKDRMQYVFSMDEFASDQKQKIYKMTLSEFENKVNQKISACLSRFTMRKCELSKIQIYIETINKMNEDATSRWNAFVKEITPVNDVGMIKNFLKSRFDSKLLSGITVKKDAGGWYSVKGDLIPSLKVNPIANEVIQANNIQAAGKTKKQPNKTRNKALKRHKKRHSRRHSRRHSQKSMH